MPMDTTSWTRYMQIEEEMMLHALYILNLWQRDSLSKEWNCACKLCREDSVQVRCFEVRRALRCWFNVWGRDEEMELLAENPCLAYQVPQTPASHTSEPRHLGRFCSLHITLTFTFNLTHVPT